MFQVKRRHQLSKPASPLILAFLVGCATMISSAPPPSDWPKLEVVVHEVSIFQVQRKCMKYVSPAGWIFSLGLAAACAEINFAANTCEVWIGDGENDPGILEHELDHCAGKSHVGEDDLARAWIAYKAGK